MKKIAFISATWHSDLLEGASGSCEAVLTDAGREVDRFVVPGALEFPLFAKRLSESGYYAAVIAFGLIVDGGIYAHEFVAEAVISGIMKVQLQTGVPILSCVLTPRQFDETPERISYFREHLIGKGREVGGACLKLLAAMEDPRLAGKG